MATKWILFVIFLWMGVSALAALTEYAWISDTEASRLAGIINGVKITSWVGAGLGGLTIAAGVAGFFTGNRAFTAVAAAFFVGFAVAFWDIITFDYPTLFYGPYEVVRWIFLIIGITIFITSVAAFLRGGTSS